MDVADVLKIHKILYPTKASILMCSQGCTAIAAMESAESSHHKKRKAVELALCVAASPASQQTHLCILFLSPAHPIPWKQSQTICGIF